MEGGSKLVVDISKLIHEDKTRTHKTFLSRRKPKARRKKKKSYKALVFLLRGGEHKNE